MPVYYTNPVEYHRMNFWNYCGPACAQMILNSIGAGLIPQDELNADNPQLLYEADYHTGPRGLEKILNDNLPGSFAPNYFCLFDFNDPYTSARKICWTVFHYRVAPAVLINNGQHWVVPIGFEAPAPPTAIGPDQYEFTRLIVHDPEDELEGAPPPPPPHGTYDGCDKSGYANAGFSFVEISDTMLVLDGHWEDKRIAVCDPSPPVRVRPPRRRRRHEFRGMTLITKRRARGLAVNWLRGLESMTQDPLRRLLRRVREEEPLLVQRLDRRDAFYYIVPLLTPSKKQAVAVTVDARFGHILRDIILYGARSEMLCDIDRRGAIDTLLRKRADFAAQTGRTVLRKEGISLHPTLVWRPCRESLSPFMPFHMVTTVTERFYIRLDGKVFSKLHFDTKGL